MTAEKGTVAFDFTFLAQASKKLHGYLLHTWFMHYLGLITGNRRRWIEGGVIEPNGKPNKARGLLYLFDLNAIDLEKVTYVIGFYMYILSSHKKANYVLMQKEETKRVLYLKGFDYEGATRAGDRQAVGVSSSDTMEFSMELGRHLLPGVEIFTALSPRDLYWETADAQRYFGDFGKLIRVCSYPIRALYLNAGYWQSDIADLADRTDYFVVYVSSITESVLWEIELLKQKQRMDHATVIFDERAIANKEIQEGTLERMSEVSGGNILWSNRSSGKGSAAGMTAAEFRHFLARSFLVVSPDEFFHDIDRHKKRIAEANGPVGVGSREAPLPFRFFPAVDADALKRIREFDQSLDAWIGAQILSRAITSLPWFLNEVQLKIFTSLMLGRHDEAGRSLTIYAAVMDWARKRLFGARVSSEGLDDRERHQIKMLEDHFAMSRYSGFTLMAYENSDEFGDYVERANEMYEHNFASAAEAIGSSFQVR